MAQLVNPLRAKLESGAPIIGTIVSMPSPQLTQILAGCGFDWLMIDLEHGVIPVDTMQQMVTATATARCVPLVRVAWNVPWLVKPALDSGALGVVFPMIRNAEEAKLAIASCHYPPKGDRGWGPFYAPSRWGISAFDYTRAADAAVLKIFLIEHIDAIRNIDEILAVPGLDAAIVAPFDLSTSLGKPGAFDDPDFLAAVDRAERAILASPAVLGGLAATAERANQQLAKGYRMLLMAYDVLLIENAMRSLLGAIDKPA